MVHLQGVLFIINNEFITLKQTGESINILIAALSEHDKSLIDGHLLFVKNVLFFSFSVLWWRSYRRSIQNTI